MRKIASLTLRSLLVGAWVSASLLAAGPAATWAAAPEPDFVLASNGEGYPLMDGPCGVGVDMSGNFYIASYYRRSIDIFTSAQKYLTQLSNVDPLGGPCGVAVGGSGSLYVSNYHRKVDRFTPSIFPPTSSASYSSMGVVDPSHSTGVAVDVITNNVYVNGRTHVAVYQANGAPILDGGDPMRIGQGSLGDGYGVAVSGYSATKGFVYVPDHLDDTVKIYDPAVDLEDPIQTIAGPPGGFGSLRDSAIAVDRVRGDVYVADALAYPQYTESPRSIIHVFDSSGAYKGRLKYEVRDAFPPGLAVDNSTTATQGRVYVTSNNGLGVGLYAYPPGSAITASGPAPLSSSGGGSSGSGSFYAGGAATAASASSAPPVAANGRKGASARASTIAQRGNLRVSISGGLAPKRLPRKGVAPISVSVDGRISTTDESMPPQLKALRIELNRNGHLDRSGLPTCEYRSIQPGSSARALSQCRRALVGRGSFTANITLAGQEPYPTVGRMLLFNGQQGRRTVLYGHIYSARPFATSFVITFTMQKLRKGTYGIRLNAPLPKAMDAWGRLTGLQMTLGRRYFHQGKRHSYISAGCPAPKGFPSASFSLARTSFAFAGGKELTSVLGSSCKARG